jgi:hypothetical protein
MEAVTARVVRREVKRMMTVSLRVETTVIVLRKVELDQTMLVSFQPGG